MKRLGSTSLLAFGLLTASACDLSTLGDPHSVSSITASRTSVVMTGPGTTRVQVDVGDSQGGRTQSDDLVATIETTGALTAAWVSTGEGLYHVKIDATAPGTGTVKLTVAAYSTTINVEAVALSAKAVDFGTGNACAIAIDDSLWCWGGNKSAQLGTTTAYRCDPICRYGSTTYGNETPLHTSAAQQYKAVATTGYSCTSMNEGSQVCGMACGITQTFALSCNGVSAYGFPSASFKALVLRAGMYGDTQVCGLGLDDKAYCIIAGKVTEIGAGKTFRSVGVGAAHSCAIDAAGDLWCWGSNASGQLGIGVKDTDPHPTPVRVAVGSKFAAIDLFGASSCALDDAGKAYCWGAGFGDWHAADCSTGNPCQPSPQPLQNSRTYTAISVGQLGKACALAGDGTVDCWEGLGNAPVMAPVQPGLTGVSVGGGVPSYAVASSFPYYACGVSTDHVVYCWNSAQSYKIGQ